MTKTATKISTPHRQSNIELFRIILMLLIIASHYVVNSGLLPLVENDTVNVQSVFLGSISAFGKICINCFILITGYFMCKSHITLKKFLKFVFEVIFYYTVIYLLFCICGFIEFSPGAFIRTFLPVKAVTTDFTSAYILFFLCIPFANILIRNLTKNQHLCLMLLLLFIYSILGSLSWPSVAFNYVSWFFVVYLISSYIRLYPGKHSKNIKLWLAASIGAVVLASLSVAISLAIRQNNPHYSIYNFVRDANKILAVFTAVSFFMLFKNLKIKYNKFINYLAASTFGVLLIHASGYVMTKWLWDVMLKNPTMYNNSLLPLHLFLSVIGVYTVCIVIDKIRIRFLERPLFNAISPKLDQLETKIRRKLAR